MSVAQVAYDPDVYKKRIKEFYIHILNTEFTSLKDYNYFFGPFAEDEIYLFFKDCEKMKSEKECTASLKERTSRWSSYESLVFLELKKSSDFLVPGKEADIQVVLSKMKIFENIHPSAIDVELNFYNEKIVFIMNDVEGEPPFIIDILLPDRSSIFKKIGTRQE